MSEQREHDDRPQQPLRRVGALWKPKPGTKSLGSGSLAIGDKRQRFLVLKNTRKVKDTDPDYVLMSGDQPEANLIESGRLRPYPGQIEKLARALGLTPADLQAGA